jgi:hypothetical protein
LQPRSFFDFFKISSIRIVMDNINGIPFFNETDSVSSLFDFIGPAGTTFPSPDPPEPYTSPLDECNGTCEHTNRFYGPELNFKDLAKDLRSGIFFSKKIIGSKYATYRASAGMSSFGVPVTSSASSSVNIKYVRAGQTVTTDLSGSVNMAQCCLSSVLHLGVAIKENKGVYIASWYYHDAEEKIVVSNNNYNVPFEYKAININARDYYDLEAFIKEAVSFGSDSHLKQFRQRIINDFKKAFKTNSNDASALKDLYESAPGFVINSLSNEQLWNDFIMLMDYDDDGITSGWRDGSNAVIKILQYIPDRDYLLKKLKEDQSILLRIYDNLDGDQEINGIEMENRDWFCALLQGLSQFDKNKKAAGVSYTIGRGYKVNSEVKGNKIVLQQLSPSTTTIPDIRRDEFGVEENYGTKTINTLDAVGAPVALEPLDFVTLVDAETGETEEVPALYLKRIDDIEDWALVMTFVYVGILIVSIILSAGTLIGAAAGTAGVTTSAGVLVLAGVDLAVSVTDLTMFALKDVLDEKNWFVQNWDKIAIAAGIGAFSPVLLKGIILKGPKLLGALENMGKSLTKPNLKNYIRSLVASAIMNMEIANFTKGTLKIIDTTIDAKGILTNFSTQAVTRLQKAGVLFIKGQMQVGKKVKEGVIVIYKGEILVSGEASRVRNAFKDIWNASDSKLLNRLDNFFDTVGLINYGRSRLGNIAIDFRKTLADAYHNGNIAVFEYLREGKYQTKAFTTLTDPEWQALGFNSKPHAEEIGFKWFEDNGTAEIKAIYSELEPCVIREHNCKKEIIKRFPQAIVSHSYAFTSNPKVMKAAIINRAKDLKTILK